MMDITDSLVFIVDDDQGVADTLSRMIQTKLNVETKVFYNDSFLQDPDLKNVDLLIIDIRLPGDRNGVKLAYEALKENHFAILFISGYDFDEIEHDEYLSKIQVYDFITKPIAGAVFTNRVRLLLGGMKYINMVIKDKEAIESRFWSLLKNMVGIYCIFTDIDGKIVYADCQFWKDIGINCKGEMFEVNIHDIIKGFNPDHSAERQDFLSGMRDLTGKSIAIAKWHTWFINSHTNLYLTIGIPLVSDLESETSILNYYKNVINSDKVILDLLKSTMT